MVMGIMTMLDGADQSIEQFGIEHSDPFPMEFIEFDPGQQVPDDGQQCSVRPSGPGSR